MFNSDCIYFIVAKHDNCTFEEIKDKVTELRQEIYNHIEEFCGVKSTDEDLDCLISTVATALFFFL